MVDHPDLPGAPIDRAGRDPARTPVQWRPGAGGGFSRARPWLPTVDPDRANVAQQSADPGSLLSWYRSLIALRRRTPALRLGSLRLLSNLDPAVLGYDRIDAASRLRVLANFADAPLSVDVGSWPAGCRLLAGTQLHRHRARLLDGGEGVILRLP